MTPFDCVIPVAGASSRMGAWKPLLPWGGHTLVEEALSIAEAAGCRVILVAGNRAEEIKALLGSRIRRSQEGLMAAAGLSGREALGFSNTGPSDAPTRDLSLPLELVVNSRWELGMLGSIQAALPSVRSESFFVLPADMPLVPVSAFEGLRAARSAEASVSEDGLGGTSLPCEPAAYFPAFQGKPGHPVLIPTAWASEIAGLDPSGSLKSFLMKRRWRLVEIASDGILRDLDTESEYRSALTGSRQARILTP